MALQDGQIDQSWLRKLNFYQNASPGAIEQYRRGYHTATPQETVTINRLQNGARPAQPNPLRNSMVGMGVGTQIRVPESLFPQQSTQVQPQPFGGLQSAMVPNPPQPAQSTALQRLLSIFQ